MTTGERISRREIAATNGVEIGTVRKWEQRPGFPAPIYLSSTHVVYDRGTYERWLASRIAARPEFSKPPQRCVETTENERLEKPVLSEMRKSPE